MTVEEFSNKIDTVFNDIKNILIAKNKSYGFSVFADDKLWNTIGLITRIGDKENRLKYLMKKFIEEHKSDEPFGESLDDAINDILGYCILLKIAQMK